MRKERAKNAKPAAAKTHRLGTFPAGSALQIRVPHPRYATYPRPRIVRSAQAISGGPARYGVRAKYPKTATPARRNTATCSPHGGSRGRPRTCGHFHSTRKIGNAMLNAAWKIVSHIVHTQFTPAQWPYEPSTPTTGEFGSNIVFTVRASSMIPYAAPRRRIPGHPARQRMESSRHTRTPAPYSQRRRATWIGFSQAIGGVDPVIASGRNAARPTRTSTMNRFDRRRRGAEGSPGVPTFVRGRIKPAGTLSKDASARGGFPP